jgi:hybrid cluster-associated redox disulfide protein
MTTVNKEMLIMDALGLDSGLVPVMQSHGLNCFGCPSSRGKTLEMAAQSHGVDIDQLIADMNAHLNGVT